MARKLNCFVPRSTEIQIELLHTFNLFFLLKGEQWVPTRAIFTMMMCSGLAIIYGLRVSCPIFYFKFDLAAAECSYTLFYPIHNAR